MLNLLIHQVQANFTQSNNSYPLCAGIYDFYIDIPQQKIIIIGWADPEGIIKTIKKVRKLATICSQTETPDPYSQPPQPPPDGGAPPPDGGPQGPGSGNAPPAEPQCSEAARPRGPPQQEPPNYQPPPPENPPDQNPPPETNPTPQATDVQPTKPPNPRYGEEVRVVHHGPPDYSCRGGYVNRYGPRYNHSTDEHWGSHPGRSYRHGLPHQPVYPEPPTSTAYHEPLHQQVYHKPPPQPVYCEPPPEPVYSEPPPQPYVIHSYNRYRPPPTITEYQYVRSPPPYITYDRMDSYYMDSHHNGSTSNGNVTSMFSDENPNACTIV